MSRSSSSRSSHHAQVSHAQVQDPVPDPAPAHALVSHALGFRIPLRITLQRSVTLKFRIPL